MWIRIPFILALFASSAWSTIIEDTNLFNLATDVGIRGGIPPIASTYATYDSTITTFQLRTAITNASASATGTNVIGINLQAGNYTLGAITILSNVVLNGAGPTTHLEMSGAFTFTGPSIRTTDTIVRGSDRGSTAIVLTGSTMPPVGTTMWISELNDSTRVTPSGMELGVPTVYDYLGSPDATAARIRAQGVRVTATSASTKTVTFFPALADYYTDTPRAEWCDPGGRFGLQNMTISNYVGVAMYFTYAQDFWLSNVVCDIATGDNPFVQGFWTDRSVIQRCTFQGWHPGASAIVPYVKNEGWRIEDNIFKRCNQTLIVVGSGGRTYFAYNYTESVTNGTFAIIAEIGGHGGHPSRILMVGNVIWKFQADSVHGSGERWMLVRNQVKMRRPDNTFGAGGIWIDHTNYMNWAVGNVLGYSGISDGGYGYTEEQVSDGSTGWVNSINAWRYGFCGYWPYAVDPYCKSSTTKHGNYNHYTATLSWDGTISDHRVPDDPVNPVKPFYFGSLAWPGAGPDVAGYTQTYVNAAHYRDANAGADPPVGGKFELQSASVKTTPRTRVAR